MELKKFVSVPVVYVNLVKNSVYGKITKVNINQNVAAKYMSMKLLCCSTNTFSSQLDMFP